MHQQQHVQREYKMKKSIRIRTLIMILVVFTSLLSSAIFVAAELCSSAAMVDHVDSMSGGSFFGFSNCDIMADKYNLDANHPAYTKCLTDAINKQRTFENFGGGKALAGIAYATDKSCQQIAQEYLNNEQQAAAEGYENGNGLLKTLEDYPNAAEEGINSCKGLGLCNQHDIDSFENDPIAQQDALEDLSTQNSATSEKGKAFQDYMDSCTADTATCKKQAIDKLWQHQEGTFDSPLSEDIMADNSVLIPLVADNPEALAYLADKIEESNEGKEDKEEIYGETLENSLPPADPTTEVPEDWEEDGEFSDMDDWEKTDIEQEGGELPGEDPEPDPPCWVTKSCIHPKNPLRPYSCQDNCAQI